MTVIKTYVVLVVRNVGMFDAHAYVNMGCYATVTEVTQPYKSRHFFKYGVMFMCYISTHQVSFLQLHDARI